MAPQVQLRAARPLSVTSQAAYAETSSALHQISIAHSVPKIADTTGEWQHLTDNKMQLHYRHG
jgi:hypothetical protein